MNTFLTRHYRVIFTVLLAALLFLAFLMGYLTGKQAQSPAVTLSCSPEVLQALTIPLARLSQNVITGESGKGTGAFVGSKNGTKYYRPECAGVKRINPANYIWFKDAADAELQGYSKAQSC